MPVIKREIAPDSILHADSYRSYNALDVSGFHHHRINHSERFGDGKNHINGTENFWSQEKRVLRKYNDIPKTTFPWGCTGFCVNGVSLTRLHPLFELDRKAIQRCFPVADGHRPLLADVA